MKSKTYIIAEAGVNHNGSVKMAKELIDVAANAGADAVKFQTFKAEALVSQDAPKAGYQKETTGSSESQFDMLKKLELSHVDHEELINYSKSKKIQFLSTAFDLDSLKLLADTYDLPLLKIPSGEITNAQLLLKVAQFQKPVLLSTGMSTLNDIEVALGILAFGYLKVNQKPSLKEFAKAFKSNDGQEIIKKNITILQCTTAYPAEAHEVNLLAMDLIAEKFQTKVGYSDHTLGIVAPIAAVARGASVIEKHFTLSRDLPGPDHRASLEPLELQEMIKSIRLTEKYLGHSAKEPSHSEKSNALVARRSLVAAQDIASGELFTDKNLTSMRPNNGISAVSYFEYLGEVAKRSYRKGDPI